MRWAADPGIDEIERDYARGWIIYATVGKEKHKLTAEKIEGYRRQHAERAAPFKRAAEELRHG